MLLMRKIIPVVLGMVLGAGFLGLLSQWFVYAEPGARPLISPMISQTLDALDYASAAIPKGWPVARDAARVSSEFGLRRHPIYKVVTRHNGVDLAVEEGTPVYSTGEGVVVFAGPLLHYGKIVKIWHVGEYDTFYAHNSKLLVRVGDAVKRGDLIALSGNTGLSTGPHVHYEVRKCGVPQNPRNFLN